MRLKRWLFAFVAILLSLVLLCSCADPAGNQTDSTDTTAQTEAAETEDTDTEESTTETAVPELIPCQTAVVENPDWGYRAYSVGVSEPTIAAAKLLDGGDVEVVSYNPGACEVYVYDCFGHKAIIEVTVADDEARSIAYQANPCVEQYIDAYDFGVRPYDPDGANEDHTANLQAAIDYAYEQGGGTVYLYPGIYDIDFLHIRDNVTLEMYSGFEDATDGFTDALAEMVENGEVTVLRGTRIMNNQLNANGRDGSSDFTIRGGVLDNNNSTRTIFLFGLASNVVIENVIMKDIKNDHMIQITGCDNVKIKNCIFAGFVWGGTFTREVIQIEPSMPGAHGSADTAPQRFAEGEYICPENVEIDNCYFGPSDENPGPHIAIGHHWCAHEANCDTLKITNCFFDRCSYSAIRFANIVNVEITGNKFVASKDANKLCNEINPAFIILYTYNEDVTYTNIVDDRLVTKALANEQSGSHHINIQNNEFIVEQGSDKRIITAGGNNQTPGALYWANVLRQDTYDSTPYTVSGYFATSNYMSDLSFCNNKIVYEGQPTVNDYMCGFSAIHGVLFEDNDIQLNGGCTFKQSYQNINGLSVTRCTKGEAAETYKMDMQKSDKHILLTHDSGSTVKIMSDGNYLLTLIATEGGSIKISSTRDGNITVDVIADDGYRFAGWVDDSGAAFNKTGEYTITKTLKLKAIFEKG